MPNQDVTLTMSGEKFNDFSEALSAFNKRTEEVNDKLKKAKYAKVHRFPVSADVAKHTITVCLSIKDRSKVLWQELTEIIDKYKVGGKADRKPAKPAPKVQWGVWVPCADEATARAAAGFLTAVAKVGTPQVESRG